MNGSMLPDPRDKLLAHLLAELRDRDLRLYLEWSMKVVIETMPTAILGPEFHDDYRLKVCFLRIEAAFREWSSKEPEQAEQWGAAHATEWARLHATPLSELAFAGLLQRDLPKACARMNEMPTEKCLETLRNSGGLGDDAQVAAFANWAAGLEEVDKRRRLLAFALTKREQIEMTALSMDDRSWLAIGVIGTTRPVQVSDTAALSRDAFSWLDKILPSDRASYAKGAVLGKIWQSEKAMQFLSRELGRRHDDDLIAGFVEAPNAPFVDGHREHGELGFRMAIQVQDPERRAALLATAWKRLQSDSPKIAGRMLELPELSAADRAKFVQERKPRVEEQP